MAESLNNIRVALEAALDMSDSQLAHYEARLEEMIAYDALVPRAEDEASRLLGRVRFELGYRAKTLAEIVAEFDDMSEVSISDAKLDTAA